VKSHSGRACTAVVSENAIGDAVSENGIAVAGGLRAMGIHTYRNEPRRSLARSHFADLISDQEGGSHEKKCA